MVMKEMQNMDESLKEERVCLFSKNAKKVKRLFRSAFPAVEKIPFWILRLFSLRRGIDFLSFSGGGVFVGFTYLVSYKKTTFVLYLATDDSLRGKGYGSRILSFIKDKKPGQRIVLNIEPLDDKAPNAEQRRKRLAFYEKNGFAETGYVVRDSSASYDALCCGSSFDPDEYGRLLSRLALHLAPQKVEKKEN
jgi:GNAT superfamily N-acetyltransferase